MPASTRSAMALVRFRWSVACYQVQTESNKVELVSGHCESHRRTSNQQRLCEACVLVFHPLWQRTSVP